MEPQTFELIPAESLLDRVHARHQEGCRFVGLSATRLPDGVELTYSFDLNSALSNLRVQLPAVEPKVPSISSLYWCAFLYENEIHDLFNVQVEGLAVDFKGSLYKTAVKFPFGSTQAPAVKTAAAPKPAPTPAKPGPATPA
jgi:ech hydrogenase subunit D